MTEQGYRVLGTVKSVNGTCSASHKVGDQFELSGLSSGGLCGFFYHDIFPYLIMLELSGGFPSEWGDPDAMEMRCPDQSKVIMEIRRFKK